MTKVARVMKQLCTSKATSTQYILLHCAVLEFIVKSYCPAVMYLCAGICFVLGVSWLQRNSSASGTLL